MSDNKSWNKDWKDRHYEIDTTSKDGVISNEDGKIRAEIKSSEGNGSLEADAVAFKDGNYQAIVAETGGSTHFEKHGAFGNAGASLTAFQSKSKKGCIDVLKVDTGYGMGAGTSGLRANVNAGVTLVGYRDKHGNGCDLRANVDTGVAVGDGSVSASLAGFGATVGKRMGIKTPIGEVRWGGKKE